MKHDLTDRQREVIKLVCDDLPTKSVAVTLGISPKTVEFHINKVYRRIGIMGRCGLTKWALRNGLTTL